MAKFTEKEQEAILKAARIALADEDILLIVAHDTKVWFDDLIDLHDKIIDHLDEGLTGIDEASTEGGVRETGLARI